MSKERTFASGFIEGWTGLIGHKLVLPEIPSPPIQSVGSPYIQGLMAGIEAAKKAALEMANTN
jgi:hypothetical protein